MKTDVELKEDVIAGLSREPALLLTSVGDRDRS